jgi:excisionase family DNA binding protein
MRAAAADKGRLLPQASPNTPRASGLVLELPDDLIERIAERAAELVAERLDIAPATESAFLTVAEVAELLSCKPQRVYDLLSAGSLGRFKDGSRVLVRRADVVAHLLPTTSRARTGRTVAR